MKDRVITFRVGDKLWVPGEFHSFTLLLPCSHKHPLTCLFFLEKYHIEDGVIRTQDRLRILEL